MSMFLSGGNAYFLPVSGISLSFSTAFFIPGQKQCSNALPFRLSATQLPGQEALPIPRKILPD